MSVFVFYAMQFIRLERNLVNFRRNSLERMSDKTTCVRLAEIIDNFELIPRLYLSRYYLLLRNDKLWKHYWINTFLYTFCIDVFLFCIFLLCPEQVHYIRVPVGQDTTCPGNADKASGYRYSTLFLYHDSAIKNHGL